MATNYPKLPEMCLDASGYVGEQDYVNTYLGFDNFLTHNPQVTLHAVLQSDIEVQNFMAWWRNETKEGYEPFIVTTTIFGKLADYGVRQISKIQHSTGKAKTISFRAEILFRTDLLTDNEPPTALEGVSFVGEDTRDNFIVLKGIDPEGDPLTFNIMLAPANGTLTGTPPNLLYTPRAGFEGSDCFNFTVSDRFQTSTHATVEVVVGGQEIPTAHFRYIIGEDGVRVTGNYHYREGEDINLYSIKRGTGGVIKPAILIDGTTTGVVDIWSDDHQMDMSTGMIESCTVIDWGERKNYENFLADSQISSFSSNNAVGSCQGTIFTNMFKNVTTQLSLFDTSTGVYFNGMFEGYSGRVVPVFNLSNGLYFDRMFKNCAADFYGAMNTVKGQYFKEMLYGSAYKCIPSIDTTSAINMVGMFGNNPNKVHPNDAEINTILTKTQWTTPEPCGVDVTGITFTSGSETCEIATIDGSCITEATYTITTTTSQTTVSYAWYISANSNATITAGATTSAVTINRDSSITGAISIGCVVTDDTSGKVTDSGLFEFIHNRTQGYQTITLTSQTEPIDLSQVILDNVPAGYVGEVLINNARIQPQINTGDLSPYSKVRLVNTGEAQAYSRLDGALPVGGREETALRATSAIEIDNRGAIRGCGGKGGTGGVGLDDTYNVITSETRSGNYVVNAVVNRTCTKYTQIAWGGVYVHIAITTSNGAFTIPNVTGKFYRGSFRYTHKGDAAKCSAYPNGADYVYDIRREITTTTARIGGQGGQGGQGIGFGIGSKVGVAGSSSTPAGGYVGGRGGRGGAWGSNGSTGYAGGGQSGNGQVGLSAGKAIIGNSFITWIKQGVINGGIE